MKSQIGSSFYKLNSKNKPEKTDLKYPLIKKKRVSCLMGIRELANKIGVSRQTLCDYEHGKYPPSEEVFKLLCKVLGLKGSIFEYYGREPKKLLMREKICSHKKCGNPVLCRNVCAYHYKQLTPKRRMPRKKTSKKTSKKTVTKRVTD